ncbi:hypothetical protein, partial [Methylobacterium nigriterrae]|uniref:hypothetical protein n=1 Tax=Methylobacterium nigriterrae TaxID=3127512 RepID=UPI003013B581
YKNPLREWSKALAHRSPQHALAGRAAFHNIQSANLKLKDQAHGYLRRRINNARLLSTSG